MLPHLLRQNKHWDVNNHLHPNYIIPLDIKNQVSCSCEPIH